MRRRHFINLIGGAAALWPAVAHAQQPAPMRRISYLGPLSESDPANQSWVRTLIQSLEELGWKKDVNVKIKIYFGEADFTRISALADEIVDEDPDVIVATGPLSIFALRQFTLSIPIVFVQVADPVSVGFVTNLARPEGNVTGFTNFEFSIGGKWLQFIKQSVPTISRIAIIFDPANPTWTAYLRTIEAVSQSFGVKLTPIIIRGTADIKQRIPAFAREPNGAAIVLPGPTTNKYRELMISVIGEQRLPTMYRYRYFVVDGGLMSYGVNLLDSYKESASYVDRILKGAKISELPIQQPTKFEFVINLKTAKELGIDIPTLLLSRADEVIE